LVNEYGIDTLETGSMIAWAMELYEKGILTDADTDGLKLEWGNDEAVFEMITRIASARVWATSWLRGRCGPLRGSALSGCSTSGRG
jgi:aldehyde:ferredoxin oxidoreductase